MINTYVSAKLIDYQTIRVFIFSDIRKPENTKIKLIKNETISDLTIVRESFINGLELYECKTKEKIELGNDYYISIESFGYVPLSVNDATSFPGFDEEYYYDGNDLGFTYNKEFTTWKIWAPLASRVILFLKKDDEIFTTYKMERTSNGVFVITLKGDFDGYKYRYQVTNSGLTIQTTDPYAKASTANGHDSCVIDFDKVKVDLLKNNLPTYKEYVDTIIYELHVRDFTIDTNTNITFKGKYLGLSEFGKTTKGGNPAGLDYLKSLGITHVQLLPIQDYKTVDELNPNETYNWGYDPQQYFVPEGSYSTNPNDPYKRIIECKNMIRCLHKAGIKVNMDVVYNHVYQFDHSVFEAVVPNYYFRKQKNGLLSVASGCGNELDTERPMVRKLILDSCKYWVEEYGVDGFRFDLMGLIDIDTINLVYKMGKEHQSDFMVYGEGWNMPSSLEEGKRCTIVNAFKTPDIMFFNDSFRDIVRGPNGFDKSKEPGYLLGNLGYYEGFKFALLGSCVDYCFPKRFANANQSLNYVECHDNQTLYDKIKICLPQATETQILTIINSVNASISLAFGVPFYHAGQEIALTKFGDDNTYNKGDKYNKFDWSMLDKHFEMFLFLRSIIQFRKTMNNLSSSKEIAADNLFINYDHSMLGFEINHVSGSIKQDYLYVFNPNNFTVNLDFDDYYNVFVAKAGVLNDSDVYVRTGNFIPYQIEGFIKASK
jgi:pullulanase